MSSDYYNYGEDKNIHLVNDNAGIFINPFENDEAPSSRRRLEDDGPTLSYTIEDTRTQDEKDRDFLIAELIQQERLLDASVGAFNNLVQEQAKNPASTTIEYQKQQNELGNLAQPIDNYQNKIRNILSTSGVSPDGKYSDIFNMYVVGQGPLADIADRSGSNERLKALNDEIDGKTERGKLPDSDQLNRRRMGLLDDLLGGGDDLGGLPADGTLQSGQTPASQGMGSLQDSGNLDPADIDKIASNLEGQGASQSEIDDAQNLRDNIPDPTKEQDFTIDTDDENELTYEDKNLANLRAGRRGRPLPYPDLQEPAEPQRTPGGYLGDDTTDPADPQRTPGGYLGDDTTDPANPPPSHQRRPPKQPAPSPSPAPSTGIGFLDDLLGVGDDPSEGIDPLTESNTDLGGGTLGGDVVDETGASGLIPDDPDLRGGGLQGGQRPITGGATSYPMPFTGFQYSHFGAHDHADQPGKMADGQSSRTYVNEPTYHKEGVEAVQMLLGGLKGAVLDTIRVQYPMAGNALNIVDNIVPDEVWQMASKAVAKLVVNSAGKLFTSQEEADRNLFVLKDKHSFIKHPAMAPLLIVGFKLYVEYLEMNIPTPFINTILNYIASNILKLDAKSKEFFRYCVSEFPNNMLNAFKTNLHEINQFDEQWSSEIEEWRQKISAKHFELFDVDILKAIKDIEGGKGFGLEATFLSLHSPHKLHEIGALFKTTGAIFRAEGENRGLILALCSLSYMYANKLGQLDTMSVLSRLQFDGIIRYTKIMKEDQTKFTDSIELQAQKNSELPLDKRGLDNLQVVDGMNTDGVVMFKDNNNNYHLVYRGTNFKEKQKGAGPQALKNILNQAGSRELFSNPLYNTDLRNGMNYIEAVSKRPHNKITISGYSFGGVLASVASTQFPDLETKLYNPIFSKTEMTNEIFDDLISRDSNISINWIDDDPISSNVRFYKQYVLDNGGKEKIKFTEKKGKRYFPPHSMDNF